MKVPPHEFVRWYFFVAKHTTKRSGGTFRLPVLEQPKVHYAQKNRNDV